VPFQEFLRRNPRLALGRADFYGSLHLSLADCGCPVPEFLLSEDSPASPPFPAFLQDGDSSVVLGPQSRLDQPRLLPKRAHWSFFLPEHFFSLAALASVLRPPSPAVKVSPPPRLCDSLRLSISPCSNRRSEAGSTYESSSAVLLRCYAAGRGRLPPFFFFLVSVAAGFVRFCPF